VNLEQPESVTRDIICEYLTKRGAFVWPDRQVVGKPGKGTFRRSNGVSDLLGIWKGYPLAVEVKRKSGELSVVQWQFLDNFRKAGGISIVATSIEDVERELKSWLPPVRMS